MYLGAVVVGLAFGGKASLLRHKQLSLSIIESRNFIKSFDEVSVFFDFAFALAMVDIAPEEKTATAAAAGIPPKRFHRFPISPMPIPSMPNILITCDI